MKHQLFVDVIVHAGGSTKPAFGRRLAIDSPADVPAEAIVEAFSFLIGRDAAAIQFSYSYID